MNKKSVIGIIIAAIINLAIYPLGSSSGLIHPVCYAFVGTLLPMLFAFTYLYTASRMKFFGAALVLNGVVLIAGLATGEGDLLFAAVLAGLTILSEVIRGVMGYEKINSIKWSFIPFAYSYYTYTMHWWTDTQGSLNNALEEMPEGYAAKMEAVINAKGALVLALILVIPVAYLGINLALKVMKKSRERLN